MERAGDFRLESSGSLGGVTEGRAAQCRLQADTVTTGHTAQQHCMPGHVCGDRRAQSR